MNTTTPYEAEILSRVLDPRRGELTPEAARSILSMRFCADDIDRMNDLSQRSSRGELTPGEAEELSSYERIGHLLGILHSKARQSLRSADTGEKPD